jgi:outer membrane immunogenic protein
MSRGKSGIWLTASALGALLPLGPALAADLPVKAKPILAATFDWSGVYIGAHAGYGGGMKDWASGGTGGLVQADFVARGPLAGGQVGINKQLGSFVFGLELDGSWADVKGSSQFTEGSAAVGTMLNFAHSSRIDGLATIAGRAGLAADRWFVFAKAGITAAHESHSFLFVLTLPAPGATLASNGSEIRYAPMLGFGAEYALTGNWSLFGEYNFHYLGERTVAMRGTLATGGVTTPFAADQRIDQSIHVAKVGVNYRFGGVAVDPSYASVPPAPGTNWTGAFIGVQGGYGWGRAMPDGLAPSGSAKPNYDMDGWLAGGAIGANAQAGSLVFGVEGEILGTGLKGSQTATFAVVGGATQTVSVNSKIDWLALATARAGFVTGSNLMLYGKAGVAIAEESHGISISATPPPTDGSFSGKAAHTGVVAGVGGEYAFAPNWSIKAEYDYVKMFRQAFLVSGTLTGGAFAGSGAFVLPVNKLNQDIHLVKFGVNYHFNPLPVVVAKY